MDNDGNVSIDVSWEDCGTDLASYYETLEGRSKVEKYLVKEKIVGVGNCAAASESFMNDQMLVPKVLTVLTDYTTRSNLRDGEVVKGNWHHVSFGCSLQRDSLDIHYNRRTDAQNTDHYTPVCINA